MNKKLVMWLVIAAIPVGILAYSMSQRSPAPQPTVSDTTALLPSDSAAPLPTSETTPSAAPLTTPAATPATTPTTTSAYKDGTYSATGSYTSPGGQEEVNVSLTIKNDVITDSTFAANSPRPISARFQQTVSDKYKPMVIGKKLADLKLGAISGSSLTPIGFNDAVAKIRVQAQS